MEGIRKCNSISKRIEATFQRVETSKQADLYLYNLPISELHGGSTVSINGREMSMFASYSYLGLTGHPRINQAAQKAIEEFGTGTHGVRLLAGSLTLHRELERCIAEFKGCEEAITYSSGYIANLTAISALLGRHDYVFSDKLNHASIVDGCLLSGANFVRFRHNDMNELAQLMDEVPKKAGKLVVADAVFSMDGDIIDLPRLAEVCQKNNAWLMIDEAHSLGVLGASGRGIEEHFGLYGIIDIQMGTLSKTIPSTGGYIAGSKELVNYLHHHSRGYIFSAALSPAQAAAALESFRIMPEEAWRVKALRDNTSHFISGLRSFGFDTMNTETAIIPILCETEDVAFQLAREAHRQDIFVLPVIPPAVPQGLARLRTTVTAAHTQDQIDHAIEVLHEVGASIGLV